MRRRAAIQRILHTTCAKAQIAVADEDRSRDPRTCADPSRGSDCLHWRTSTTAEQCTASLSLLKHFSYSLFWQRLASSTASNLPFVPSKPVPLRTLFHTFRPSTNMRISASLACVLISSVAVHSAELGRPYSRYQCYRQWPTSIRECTHGEDAQCCLPERKELVC